MVAGISTCPTKEVLLKSHFMIPFLPSNISSVDKMNIMLTCLCWIQQNGAAGGGDNGNHHGILSKIGGLASHLLKTKITDSPTAGGVHRGSGTPTDREGGGISQYIQDWYSQRQRRRSKDPGILISACEPQEMSADANPTNDPRHAYGALSNALQTVVGQSRGFLTNREVVMAARKLLSQQGYRYQHPCLYCTDRNADRLFLCAVK